MATRDTVISFRVHKHLKEQLENAYGDPPRAAARITEALPFLRERTFDEIRGVFYGQEIECLIDMFRLIEFTPRFITSKAAMLQEVKNAVQPARPGRKGKINAADFVNRLERLSVAQLYFLFDYCKAFWDRIKTDEITPQVMEEYSKYLTG